MAADLETARIRSLPEDAFYIANFITEEEEDLLLQKVRLRPSVYQKVELVRESFRSQPPPSPAGRTSPTDVFKPGRQRSPRPTP
jgi:hypothetical protein